MSWSASGGEIRQPVTTSEIVDVVNRHTYADSVRLGERAVRDLVRDLETMGLVETWIESRGREGRVKQIETTFDPQWVRESMLRYLETADGIDPTDLLSE